MIYVALDLGSESMAAYYSDAFGNGGMIRLQQSANSLIGTRGVAASAISYLTEEHPGGNGNGNGAVSPRMWNRVSLRQRAQPQQVPEAHAWLKFLDNGQSNNKYEKSLFRFFHLLEEWPPGDGGVLPNPKILFQHQVKEILPKVVAEDGDHYDLSPLMLIKHLTLQVILNFVLDSDELRGFPRDEIHLTITVPNVYSLPHGESIKNFVKTYAGVREVEIISESDAVAYYVLAAPNREKDPTDLYNFKERLGESLTRRRRLCIVTIDVGKGTTDLSCILKEEPRKHKGKGDADPDMRQKHSVQGKTGKSSGGNYLNYIFAQFYNDRLMEVKDTLETETNVRLRFDFLTLRDPQYHQPQLKTVFALVNLIEQVKRNMTENYEIDEQGLPPERQRLLLRTVADEFLTAFDPLTPQESTQKYENFRELFVNALMLPRRLEESGWRAIFSRRRKAEHNLHDGPNPRPTELTKRLKRDIEKYVKENVDDMLDNLKGLVREHQPVASRRAEIDRNAFVVVSGQGSQFRPLRRAVEKKCNDMHVPRLHRHMMRGVDSKVACCKGVVSFRRQNVLHVNPDELHGTYGCLADGVRPKGEDFKPFEMAAVKNGGSSTVKFDVPMNYFVVFTPRPQKEVKRATPEQNDGSTALIEVFEGEQEFTIEYDPERLELKVNGRPLELKTFGSVDGSIYPKVWPEVLKKAENQ